MISRQIIALGAALALSGTPAASQSSPERGRSLDPVVYLPTWLDKYDKNTLAHAGELTLAFALPTPNGTVKAPEISPALKETIRNLGPKTISLAIGGYGADEAQNNVINTNWQTGSLNPEKFARSTKSVIARLGKTGIKVSGIDLDWEYPQEPNGITKIATALNNQLPKVRLSIAVPAESNPAYNRATKLWKKVDQVRVMTYDYGGPWSDKASLLAPVDWAQKSIQDWQKRVGSKSKISVGFPTYGYTFVGSKKRGDKYQKGGLQISYLDVPRNGWKMDPDGNGVTTPDGWANLMSSTAIERNFRAISSATGVRRAFFWSAEGLTKQHFQAVK